MRIQKLFVFAALFTATLLTANLGLAQRGQAKKDDGTNPRTARFGVWDNTMNPDNVMTYEKFEAGGSKLTVSNPHNPASDWSYDTNFDGVFRPVRGQKGSETAVEIVDSKTIRVLNKRDGVVYQIVLNTLNDDNTVIHNEYIRVDKDGKPTAVTHVDYKKRK
jgi:hypothetical protein